MVSEYEKPRDPKFLVSAVFLNRGSTELLVFDGAVSGVRWKSFKILTLSGAYSGAAGHLILGKNCTSEDVMTFIFFFFFGFHLILGGKLDVGRRDDLSLVFTRFWEGNRTSGLVETTTKLLGFGRLAQLKKHWVSV